LYQEVATSILLEQETSKSMTEAKSSPFHQLLGHLWHSNWKISERHVMLNAGDFRDCSEECRNTVCIGQITKIWKKAVAQ